MTALRFFLYRFRMYLAALGALALAAVLTVVVASVSSAPTSQSSSSSTPGSPSQTPSQTDPSSSTPAPTSPPQTAPDGLVVIALPALSSMPAGATPSTTALPLTLSSDTTSSYKSAPVYRLTPVSASDISPVASSLDITEKVTQRPASNGGGFSAGSLLVTQSGSYSYSRPSKPGASTQTSLAPVANLPEDAVVLEKFSKLPTSGMSLSTPRVDRTPFAVLVSATYLLGTYDTNIRMTATFGSGGELLALSGQLGSFEKVADYPVTDAASVLEAAKGSARLRDRTMCQNLSSCRVTGVALGLELQLTADQTTYLLPVHVFTDETTGHWSLPALDEAHLRRK